MLSKGGLHLHNNAHPHPVSVVKTILQQFRWETLEHPLYSPDLSPCGVHVFAPLKRIIHGHRFTTDDEVCDRVQTWIRRMSSCFFKDGINRLV
ncbi:mariner Mos1 transposase [Trichonephila clavipes]|nr:mariner Mos1 transposase [Trichonephila clavipes]